jgi:hypothetical protein
VLLPWSEELGYLLAYQGCEVTMSTQQQLVLQLLLLLVMKLLQLVRL